MKIKHLVSVLFISFVIVLLIFSGFVTTNKQKSALNTIKTSYSYSSTDLPKGVNVYKLKIEDKCKGKTCGCGELPACDPCEGKTCGCGKLPACKTINNNYPNSVGTKVEPKAGKSPPSSATGKLVKRPRGVVGYYLYNFVVNGTSSTSNYTLLLTVEPAEKLITFNPKDKSNKSYCWGADNRFFSTNNSITNNRTVCTLLVLKPNSPRSSSGISNWKYCHLVKGTKVVAKMPIGQCKEGFNLP